jgi:hypothetical protein
VLSAYLAQYDTIRPSVEGRIISKPPVTSVHRDGLNTPDKIALSQNYPNPFNPSTTIRFLLPQREFVTLEVFDILGRKVATLVNEWKEAGTYSTTLDTRNSPFVISSSGVYFYRLQVGGFVETKKLMFLK